VVEGYCGRRRRKPGGDGGGGFWVEEGERRRKTDNAFGSFSLKRAFFVLFYFNDSVPRVSL